MRRDWRAPRGRAVAPRPRRQRRRSRTPAPIVIGWAFDSKGQMAPFDGPALAAAKIRVQQINAHGGVNGAQAPDRHLRHAEQQPGPGEVVRGGLLGTGADRSSSRPATSTSRRRSSRRRSTAACSRSRRASAPTRWGRSASARRGGSRSASATWPRTRARRWPSTRSGAAGGRRRSPRTRCSSTSRTSCRRSRSGSRSSAARIVARESYATGANNVQTAVSRLNGARADVIVTSTAFGELPALVSGLRSLGNQTPILNSWAGDGTYWVTKNPQVTDYYAVTYASVFGDDPNPAVRTMIADAEEGRRRRPAPAASSPAPRRSTASWPRSERAGGSTEGAALSQQLESFKKVADARRPVSFSRAAAHRLRPPVPGDPDPQQPGALRRRREGEGRPEDLERLPESTTAPEEGQEARRDPPGLLCLALLRGRPRPRRRHARAPPARGRRADRPERRRQVDARERAHRVRLPDRRHRSSSRRATSRAGRRTGGRRAGLARTFQHSRVVPRALRARERRGRGARGRARAPAEARRRADGCSTCSGCGRTPSAPAGALAHGDERRLGVARALATRPAVRADGRARGGLCRRRRCRSSPAVVRSVRDDHDAGVLLIDHNMALVMAVCDRIHVLDQGRTLAEGTPAEIRAQPRRDGRVPRRDRGGGARSMSGEPLLVVDGPRGPLRRRRRRAGPRRSRSARARSSG